MYTSLPSPMPTGQLSFVSSQPAPSMLQEEPSFINYQYVLDKDVEFYLSEDCTKHEHNKKQTIIIDQKSVLHFWINSNNNKNLKRDLTSFYGNIFSIFFQNIPKDDCFRKTEFGTVTIKGNAPKKNVAKLMIIEGFFFSKFISLKKDKDVTGFQSSSFFDLYKKKK
jgi:hypothetical protein